MKKNEKFAFVMGFSVGVALISLIGFILVGVLYLGDKDFSFGSKANGTVEENNIDNASSGIAGEKINGVWTRGDKNAPVTILEFSDYQCPFCSRHHETMKKILEEYAGKVKWEYKHFPLDSMHPYARIVAEGAECAGDQGKFWEYTDLLYENQRSIKSEIVPQLAEQLNLDMEKFTECIKSGKYKEKISADQAEGKKMGVRGTPGNFVNGVELKGAVPFEQFKKEIDKALNK